MDNRAVSVLESNPMRDHVVWVIASLLTVSLLVCHLADDVVRGMAPGGPSIFMAMIVAAFWIYATLVLGAQRSGPAIILVGSLFAAWVSTLHMKGAGLGAGRNSGFLFVWTDLQISMMSIFGAMMSARQLWKQYRLPRRRLESK